MVTQISGVRPEHDIASAPTPWDWRISRPFLRYQFVNSLRLLEDLVHITDKPFHQMIEAYQDRIYETTYDGPNFPALFTPASSIAFYHVKLETLLAILRWNPSNPSLPRDPFTGKPFRQEMTLGKRMIRSPGADSQYSTDEDIVVEVPK